MLVLSRHVGEEIVIGGEIRVKIVSLKGSRVRLGIEAPGHIPVLRSELVVYQPDPELAVCATAAESLEYFEHNEHLD